MRVLCDGKYKLKILAHDELLTSCNTGDYVLFKDGSYLLVYLGDDVATPITDDPFENVADAVRAFEHYVSNLRTAH
ncbi:hypothetical protein SOASR029_09410 [Budvicia aquatica]|nr:hypothetical protein SOASR029_09410 [Budvicia aquatica]